MSKSVIAVFDFDETLIRRDTLFDFTRYSTSLPAFLAKSLKLSPTLALFAIHKVSNQIAKERLLAIFFGGMELEEFDELGIKYARRLDTLANEEAIQKLRWHKSQGHKVVIVSASIENWIQPWANQYDVQVIGSRLAIQKDRLTGKLDGKNVHGKEKVNRFLKAYPKRDSYELYVYGDGKSDQDMFKLADKYYEKKFN